MTHWGGWKDWSTGGFYDNRKKRPNYDSAGWINFEAQEEDHMETRAPNAYEKTSQWKGWRTYDATKWVERQNGESSAKKGKAKEPDEEPQFDSTKPTMKPDDQAENDDEDMKNSVADTGFTSPTDSMSKEEKARHRDEHFAKWSKLGKMAG